MTNEASTASTATIDQDGRPEILGTAERRQDVAAPPDAGIRTVARMSGRAAALVARAGATAADRMPEVIESGRSATEEAARALSSAPAGNLAMLTALSTGAAIGALLSGGSRAVAGGSLLLAVAAAGSLLDRAGQRGQRRLTTRQPGAAGTI
jgi:hypothetical protein